MKLRISIFKKMNTMPHGKKILQS